MPRDLLAELETQPKDLLAGTETTSPLQAFLKVAKWGITPLISEERARQSPAMMMAGRTLPSTTLMSGPVLSSLIPPYYREKMAAKQFSEQTSPTAIAGYATAGLSALREANMLPKLMTNRWKVALPQKTTEIVNNTIGNYRTAYKDTLSPHLDTPIGVDESLREILGDNPTIGNIWKTRDEVLSSLASNAWDKSQFFQKARVGQNQAMELAGRLKKLVLDNLPEETRNIIESLDPAYTEAIKLGGFIKRKAYSPKSDTYNFKSLINVFKDPEQSGARQAFQRFTQLNPEMGQVIKDATKYVGRQNLKKFGGVALGGGAGAYILHRLMAQKILGERGR